METYLLLFEKVIQTQIDILGREAAYALAKKSGLGLSEDGRVVSAAGNPHIILLRLVKAFTATGNLGALAACTPLINEFLKNAAKEEIIPQK